MFINQVILDLETFLWIFSLLLNKGIEQIA